MKISRKNKRKRAESEDAEPHEHPDNEMESPNSINTKTGQAGPERNNRAVAGDVDNKAPVKSEADSDKNVSGDITPETDQAAAADEGTQSAGATQNNEEHDGHGSASAHPENKAGSDKSVPEKTGSDEESREVPVSKVRTLAPGKGAGPGAERGLVNGTGLVNGNGLVNGTGLTNGFSMVNGKYVDMQKLLKHGYVNGEKLKVGGATGLFGYNNKRKIHFASHRRAVSLAAIVILLFVVLVPIFTYYAYPSSGIKIDGNFSDWIDKKPVIVEGNMIYLHVEGLTPTPHAYYYEVLTSDTHAHHISNLSSYHFKKGDVLIAFAGNGLPRSAVYRVYQGGNPLSASSWSAPIDLRYALSGHQAELALYRPPGLSSRNVYSFGFERSADAETVTSPASSWSYSSLVVSEQWAAPAVIHNNTVLMFLKLRAYGGDVTVRSISFSQPDYANTSARLAMSVPGTYELKNRTYVFTEPLDIPMGTEKVIIVSARFSEFSGTTVYYSVSGIGTNSPYSVSFSPVHVSYVGTPPATPRVDGGFSEWKITSGDAENDTLMPHGINSTLVSEYRSDADITRFGRIVGSSTYYYVSVAGTILHGTYVGRKDGLTQIKAASVPAGTPKPTAAVGNDEDVVYIGIDEDNSTATGELWQGIGADYLVEIRGRLQDVQNATLDKWENGKWVSTSEKVDVAISNHGLELSMPGRFTGRYVVYVDNWLGMWDTASVLGRATRATDVTDHVVINEIYIDSSDYAEWIEFYNPTGSSVDLSGWNVYNLNTLQIMYTFPTGTLISSGQYLVVTTLTNNDFSGGVYLSIGLHNGATMVDTTPSGVTPVPSESFARYWDPVNSAPTDTWYWGASTEGTQNQSIPEFSMPNLLIVVILIGGIYAVMGKRKETRK